MNRFEDILTASKTSSECLIIAEIGQAHDGSLGTAHAYIDAIANAGANAVKFQTHIAAAESSPGEPWRVPFSYQDATRYDYWKRMEFTARQWGELKRHADQRGLIFLSSPFSVEAVDLLSNIEVAAWKVASGQIADEPVFQRMLLTRLPFIISTGMSSVAETDEMVRKIQAVGVPLAVLQCTTAYPCPPEKVGLNLIAFYSARYDCPVGLSDHSGTIFPCLAAVALGATVLEVHVTFSREAFGPDVPASVTMPEFRQLVDGVKFIRKALMHPVDKDVLAAELMPVRELFTKSVCAVADIRCGAQLNEQNLGLRKPGTGLSPARSRDLFGRRVNRDIAAGTLLAETDLERRA